MGFAEKVIREKAIEHIDWINGHGLRRFDPRVDRVHVILTERQWDYVARECQWDCVHQRYNLIGDIDGYHYHFRHNDRLGIWEGYGEHIYYHTC